MTEPQPIRVRQTGERRRRPWKEIFQDRVSKSDPRRLPGFLYLASDGVSRSAAHPERPSDFARCYLLSLFPGVRQAAPDSVLMRGIQVAAASLVVLAVLFAAVRFVWNYTRGRGEPSISQEQPNRSRSLVLQRPRVQHQSAPLAMTVDLASFSPTRGEEPKEPPETRYIFHRNCFASAFFCPLVWNPGNTRFA